MANFMSSNHSVHLSVESQPDSDWPQLTFGHPGQGWFALQLLFSPQTPTFAPLMGWVADEGHKGSKDFRSPLGFPM